MKLVKPAFLDKKEDEKEYFLSLILRNEKATAVVFEKTGTNIRFLGKGDRNFSDTIENASEEEFLDCLDKSITQAESVLPPNIETHKTLFALKNSWVEDNKIKKEHLGLLDKAKAELDLDPIGFLVFSESIVNLLQQDEGAPASAILCEIGQKYVTAYLVKTGRIVEAQTSEVRESIAHTLDLVLKHFQTAEVLPARIILFGDNDEDLTQEFISFTWSKSLPFLHLPQITSLPKGSDIKAVLLGAASQMGANLLFNYDADEAEENLDTEQSAESKEPMQIKESEVEKNDEIFGFVQGADVKKSMPKKPTEHTQQEAEILPRQTQELPQEVKIEEEKKENIGTLGVSMVDNFKTSVFGIFASFTKMNFKSLPLMQTLGTKKLFIIPLVLFILVIIFLFVLSLNAKAKVEIFVTPKQDEKKTSVTFSENSDTNVDDSILNAKLVSVEESGKTTIDASGKQDIGDKAKGAVTIFNNNDSSKTFAAGTTITSPNDLDFTMDKSVTVASGSSDPINPKSGQADVSVTASKFGTEYNLPSGTKFKIENLTTVAAKNDNAFSGGTKKSVTVISKEDITKAESTLPKELSQKARDDLSQKVENGSTLLPDFVSTDLSSEDFNHKLNDEAQSLTLSANVSFNFVSYKNSDMDTFVSKLFNDSNFSVDKSPSINATNIKLLKNNDITADLSAKANLIPKIDTGKLASQIAGESTTIASNQIRNTEQVVDVVISISPHIPFVSNNLPKNSKNIQIVISSR